MKEQFVTYEIALKLKELGFDEETIAYYLENQELRLDISSGITNIWLNNNGGLYIAAPLWQQAIDWLFSNGIAVQFWFNTNTICWCTEDVFNHNTGKSIICEYLERPSLYEIREQAILKALELCKTN